MNNKKVRSVHNRASIAPSSSSITHIFKAESAVAVAVAELVALRRQRERERERF